MSSLDLESINDAAELSGAPEYPKAGTYHLIVMEAEDHPLNADQTSELQALKVTFQVLAGTVEGQQERDFTETFWDPSPTNKDGGLFLTKRRAKLALAAGLIDTSALGRRVEIDWSELVGRQIVAKVANYKRPAKNDPSRVYEGAEISGLDMHAVDDPAVEGVPKDAESLALIGGGNGSGNGSTAKTKPQPAPAKTAKQPSAYDDL